MVRRGRGDPRQPGLDRRVLGGEAASSRGASASCRRRRRAQEAAERAGRHDAALAGEALDEAAQPARPLEPPADRAGSVSAISCTPGCRYSSIASTWSRAGAHLAADALEARAARLQRGDADRVLVASSRARGGARSRRAAAPSRARRGRDRRERGRDRERRRPGPGSRSGGERLPQRGAAAAGKRARCGRAGRGPRDAGRVDASRRSLGARSPSAASRRRRRVGRAVERRGRGLATTSPCSGIGRRRRRVDRAALHLREGRGERRQAAGDADAAARDRLLELRPGRTAARRCRRARRTAPR